MAKESGESMTLSTTMTGGDGTAALRGDIERTRGEMASTVNQIEERLSPAHIKEQIANVTASVTSDIEDKVAELKESVVGGYHETKDHLKEDLGREIRDARHMVSDELTHARAAVREATVGRVEHMVQDARDSVTQTGTSIMDTIKANPVPAALVGIGLGWLLFGARSSGASRALRSSRSAGQRASLYRASGEHASADDYAYDDINDEQRLSDGPRRALRQGQRAIGGAVHAAGEGVSHLGHAVQDGASQIGHRVQDGASQLAQGARGAVHDATDTVSHLAHDAGHRASQLASGAGRQFMRAERGAESLLRDNPLAAGAIALAVGAAISIALPSTSVEDDWMGDAKDHLFHQAEELAGDAIHGFEEKAGQLTAGDPA